MKKIPDGFVTTASGRCKKKKKSKRETENEVAEKVSIGISPKEMMDLENVAVGTPVCMKTIVKKRKGYKKKMIGNGEVNGRILGINLD